MNTHAHATSRTLRLAAGALFAAAMAVTSAAWPQAGAQQSEVDAALELYTARLSYAIARFRTAPPEGVTRYSEGVVQLRIDIGASGILERQSLLRGSGDAKLDEHAQNILKSAVPQTAIPSGLRARPFYIAVTIDFSS
jgi:TonB family protein